jgi:dihydropteroate synthase
MFPRKPYSIPLPCGRTLQVGERTLVMGILNITPDSFADGGLHLDAERAVAAGLQMVADGADILDIGGESTRPGADPVSAEEEMRRVLPVIERLAARTPAHISIDTYKAAVAKEAVRRGATIVNDISGLRYDPELAGAVAETGAALVLMHTRGRSRAMYEHAVYADVAADVARELDAAVGRAAASGVKRDAIIVDPGFGFAKRAEHSYEMLAHLPRLSSLDRPILSGPSRKSFLKEAVGDRPPAEREWATAGAVAASVMLGAHIVRVHGVRAMADVVRVVDRLRASAGG